MKVVILAGGLPSILGEENDKIPKPMVQIGERPILWHIMKLFSYYGFDDFIICTGYKSDVIKDYFLNYYIYQSDSTVHLQTNEVVVHNRVTEPWRVSIINTGLSASTSDRLKMIVPMIDNDFIVAYGDCISNINIPKLVELHQESGKKLTVALAKPTGRNTVVATDSSGNIIFHQNKRQNDTNAWVNACMMAVHPDVLMENIDKGARFETDMVQRMAEKNQVNTYRHEGFWLPVETMRDKEQLQAMWDNNQVVWRVWKD